MDTVLGKSYGKNRSEGGLFGVLFPLPIGIFCDQLTNPAGTFRACSILSLTTPLGVFEFKFFFSRAMATASGGECSATAIRGVIQCLINAESPLSPLSDAELARQGIVVARRTVTKYRQLMWIESFEGRRKVA